ncbi:4Fe-4S binding protein [Salipaludibacillus daqingensis]|uniref:4Fe-4S binding protein n=1 Tax=Salipaludibacillus daqingensis TaxID=3041001 RepID=UPI0024736F91|nr:4Fe-4S dicluster domain-containing protein [Salipaludibacillus daqingensis]
MVNILKMLEKAAESFENLAIYDSRCLHSISQKSQCSACIDACPTNGIHIQGGRVAVSDCVSCGICAKVCPTDAFIWKYPTYESLYKKLKEANSCNDPIIVSCAGSPLTIPEVSVVQIPCFDYLLDDIWTFMLNMNKGYVYLQDGACEGCFQSCNLPQQVANIRLYEEKDVRGIIYGERFDRNKRDFLRGVFSYFQEESVKKWGKKDRGNRESSRTIKKTWKKEVVELPIQVVPRNRKEITVSEEDCLGCKACSTLCPESALRTVTDEKGKSIVKIDHDKCSTCGLCVDICYFNAMTMEVKETSKEKDDIHV